MYKLSVLFFCILAFSSAARGEPDIPRCATEQIHVDPARNESVHLHSSTPAGQSCSYLFAAGGLVAIEQVEIIAKPSFGNLERAGDLRLVYRPQPGFTGQDTYLVKLCGSSLQGRGCTTVAYTMMVY